MKCVLLLLQALGDKAVSEALREVEEARAAPRASADVQTWGQQGAGAGAGAGSGGAGQGAGARGKEPVMVQVVESGPPLLVRGSEAAGEEEFARRLDAVACAAGGLLPQQQQQQRRRRQ